MTDKSQTTDLAVLERIAKSNGYWHHIEPFASEIERLRTRVGELEDKVGELKMDFLVQGERN